MPGNKTPPQNSAEAKKLGGDLLPVKARMIKVSLYEKSPCFENRDSFLCFLQITKILDDGQKI
ncbi:hypothetical protein DJ027_24130 [Bacillus cereus]|nr:hypothetical protein DJ027_24130 [Bacillus cereus]